MASAATFSHTFTEDPLKYSYYFLVASKHGRYTVSNSFSGKNIAKQSGHIKDVFCSYRMKKPEGGLTH